MLCHIIDLRRSVVLFAEALDEEPVSCDCEVEYVNPRDIAKLLQGYGVTYAGVARFSDEPWLREPYERLTSLWEPASMGSVAMEVHSLSAMIQSLPVDLATKLATLLLDYPALAELLTAFILQAAKRQLPQLTVLMVRESSLASVPTAKRPSDDPRRNRAVTHVHISAYRLITALSPTRCRALCSGISKSIETQRSWVWQLPVIRVMVLCVTSHDQISIRQATCLPPSQRANLTADLRQQPAINDLLNEDTSDAFLGPLREDDVRQVYWLISYGRDIHDLAERELHRVLAQQKIEVVPFVSDFVSTVNR